jgi:hypothetical protein
MKTLPMPPDIFDYEIRGADIQFVVIGLDAREAASGEVGA